METRYRERGGSSLQLKLSGWFVVVPLCMHLPCGKSSGDLNSLDNDSATAATEVAADTTPLSI